MRIRCAAWLKSSRCASSPALDSNRSTSPTRPSIRCRSGARLPRRQPEWRQDSWILGSQRRHQRGGGGPERQRDRRRAVRHRRLDRRHPERAKLRPTDAAGFREAWAITEQTVGETVGAPATSNRRCPHDRVDGEWSFIETLRHLVFATDCWVRRVLLGDPSPGDPLDLPWDEMPDTPEYLVIGPSGPRSTRSSPCAPIGWRSCGVRRRSHRRTAGELDRPRAGAGLAGVAELPGARGVIRRPQRGVVAPAVRRARPRRAIAARCDDVYRSVEDVGAVTGIRFVDGQPRPCSSSARLRSVSARTLGAARGRRRRRGLLAQLDAGEAGRVARRARGVLATGHRQHRVERVPVGHRSAGDDARRAAGARSRRLLRPQPRHLLRRRDPQQRRQRGADRLARAVLHRAHRRLALQRAHRARVRWCSRCVAFGGLVLVLFSAPAERRRLARRATCSASSRCSCSSGYIAATRHFRRDDGRLDVHGDDQPDRGGGGAPAGDRRTATCSA